jgi:hypothetical protein
MVAFGETLAADLPAMCPDLDEWRWTAWAR